MWWCVNLIPHWVVPHLTPPSARFMSAVNLFLHFTLIFHRHPALFPHLSPPVPPSAPPSTLSLSLSLCVSCNPPRAISCFLLCPFSLLSSSLPLTPLISPLSSSHTSVFQRTLVPHLLIFLLIWFERCSWEKECFFHHGLLLLLNLNVSFIVPLLLFFPLIKALRRQSL